jgi:hypothetical protein
LSASLLWNFLIAAVALLVNMLCWLWCAETSQVKVYKASSVIRLLS